MRTEFQKRVESLARLAGCDVTLKDVVNDTALTTYDLMFQDSDHLAASRLFAEHANQRRAIAAACQYPGKDSSRVRLYLTFNATPEKIDEQPLLALEAVAA